MKKIFCALLLILAAFSPAAMAAAQDALPAPAPQQEQIESFYILVQVDQKGVLGVTENIRYNFGAEERHGIYRDIPLIYDDGNGKLKINDIQVADEGGNLLPFETSRIGAYLRIKIGDPDVLISGSRTYFLKYAAAGAVQWGQETDRLIWNATGNEWTVPIQSALAELRVDKLGSRRSDIKMECYQGEYGSIEPCRMEPPSGNVGFTFAATRPLSMREGLTFSMILPKGILVPPTPVEGFLQSVSVYWPWILPLAAFIFFFFQWWHRGRDPQGRGTVVAQYEPPGGLSPIETGALLYGRVKNAHVSAQIIYLATRGFLEIALVQEKSFGKSADYALRKIKDTGSEEPFVDRLIMDALFSVPKAVTNMKELMKTIRSMKGKNEEEVVALLRESSTPRPSVKLSELKNIFSKSLEGIKSEVSRSLFRKGYYDRNPRQVFAAYAAAALFLFFGSFFVVSSQMMLAASLMLTAIIIFIFGWIIPKVTPKGAIEKEHIRGFRNYLDIAEKDRLNFHNAPEKSVELFENLLPYALALGVVDAWAKEFSYMYIEPPKWYETQMHASFGAVGLAKDLDIFAAVAAHTAFASSSSGSGGGGGSSGGGAGGGGGGSW